MPLRDTTDEIVGPRDAGPAAADVPGGGRWARVAPSAAAARDPDPVRRLVDTATRSRIDRLSRALLGARGRLAATEEALHAAHDTVGRLSHELQATRGELARYHEFHQALAGSRVWRLAQWARAWIGRRW